MSKYDGCEISFAVALEDLFLVNYGTLSKKLSNKGDGLNKAVKMTLDGQFVILELRNSLGKTVTELVPVTFFKQITPISK